MCENRLLCKLLFEGVKSLLTLSCPLPFLVLLCEVNKWLGYLGKVLDEPSVVVSES